MDKYSQKWVSSIFRRERWAITLFGATYYSIAAEQIDAAWRRHEDCHKMQQQRDGLIFYAKYIIYQLQTGYDLNPYEIEARRAECG